MRRLRMAQDCVLWRRVGRDWRCSSVAKPLVENTAEKGSVCELPHRRALSHRGRNCAVLSGATGLGDGLLSAVPKLTRRRAMRLMQYLSRQPPLASWVQ